MSLLAEVPLNFTKPLDNVEALPGESVTLSMELSHSGLDVTWLKDQVPLSLADGRYQTVSQDCTYQLSIANVTVDDVGEYTVRVGELQSTAVLRVDGERPALRCALRCGVFFVQGIARVLSVLLVN